MWFSISEANLPSLASGSAAHGTSSTSGALLDGAGGISPASIGGVPEAQPVTIEAATIEISTRINVFLDDPGHDLLFLHPLQLRLQVLTLKRSTRLLRSPLPQDGGRQLSKRHLVALGQQLILLGQQLRSAQSLGPRPARMPAHIGPGHEAQHHDADHHERPLLAGEDQRLKHAQVSLPERGTEAISGGDRVSSVGTFSGQR